MQRGRMLLGGCLALVVLGAIYGARLIRRGFSAAEEPSGIEKLMARAVRNLSIPARASKETNPWTSTPESLREARDHFLARCAICHGTDGSGVTQVGRNLYPKAPDLRAPETQDLTDGQIHYIIQEGVRLTGMPAWGTRSGRQGCKSRKVEVLFLSIACIRTDSISGACRGNDAR